MASDGKKRPEPFHRLLSIIFADRWEIVGIASYALINSVLLLAIPLTAQALVNVSAAGLAVQPLVVLTLALAMGLLFAGLFTCLRYFLAERVLQRIFTRVALQVAQKLPMVKSRHLCESGGPELMNRFFDVINIQKSWFKLLYDGPGAIIEILLGLSLLGLYGMELFSAAALFVGLGGTVVLLVGFGGVKSSISESAQKYGVAAWLEEMVRCQDALRLNSRPGYWTEIADLKMVSYLTERRRHFRVLLRQFACHYLVSAVGLAGMLGYGGYLVTQGRLSLGQLVAAELVVWSLFKATEKLLRACEAYFDLLTGLDKVGYITDLPVSDHGVAELTAASEGIDLVVDGVSYAFAQNSVLHDVSFRARPGYRVTVLGPTGSGKSTLLRLLAGYLTPASGSVEVDLIDLRELSRDAATRSIGYLSERSDLFAGPVLDNVAVGRECDLHKVREFLMETGGKEALRREGQGGFTSLTSAGSTLSDGERKSVLLSRVVLDKPRLLILDDSFGQLSERTVQGIVKRFFLGGNRPTVVSTCALQTTVAVSDEILFLENGKISERGAPITLARDPESRMRAHYPGLCRALVNQSGRKT